MSAWLAVSFLHSRLGVMRSKNSRAWDRAVRGTAVGLSAAAAQRAIGFLGRRQAEALFCRCWSQLSLLEQTARPHLPPKQAEEGQGDEGGAYGRPGLRAAHLQEARARGPGCRCTAGHSPREPACTHTWAHTHAHAMHTLKQRASGHSCQRTCTHTPVHKHMHTVPCLVEIPNLFVQNTQVIGKSEMGLGDLYFLENFSRKLSLMCNHIFSV